MLRELVRERLMAAADDIFGLFESTIASYEEQLCRAREESERHRRQLQAVRDAQMGRRVEDAEQSIAPQDGCCSRPQGRSYSLEQALPQPPHAMERKEDAQPPHAKDEDAKQVHVKEEKEETDISKFAPAGVSLARQAFKDELPECSLLQREGPSGDHFGRPPPDNLSAPLSDSCDLEEPWRSDADYEGDDKRWKCSEADATLKNKASPKRMRCHTREKCFGCSICGQRFAQKRLVIEHEGTHKEEKPFRCSLCDNKFSFKSHLVIHMRKHTGEKPFGCSFCDKMFSHKANLVTHRRIHTGEKPFGCAVCGEKFIQRSHMVAHGRKHAGEKSFGCSFCGKAFSRKSQMEIHVRIHTGTPHGCSFCGKVFYRMSHLVRHMRTHTGEKPFSCSLCGKAFKQNAHLLAHEHTHMRPFVCTAVACGKTFALESALVRHLATHRY